MILALAGECVSEGASSGYAIVVEAVPVLERTARLQQHEFPVPPQGRHG
jgi:hypothetical protein